MQVAGRWQTNVAQPSRPMAKTFMELGAAEYRHVRKMQIRDALHGSALSDRNCMLTTCDLMRRWQAVSGVTPLFPHGRVFHGARSRPRAGGCQNAEATAQCREVRHAMHALPAP